MKRLINPRVFSWFGDPITNTVPARELNLAGDYPKREINRLISHLSNRKNTRITCRTKFKDLFSKYLLQKFNEPMETNRIVVLTQEAFEAIINGQKEILTELRRLKNQKTSPEYLTVKETLQRLKIGRSKFDQLIANNELNYIRKGRKIMVPSSEIKRYFHGDSE